MVINTKLQIWKLRKSCTYLRLEKGDTIKSLDMRVLMVDDSPHSHLLSTKIILKGLESTVDTKREVKLSNYSELLMLVGDKF